MDNGKTMEPEELWEHLLSEKTVLILRAWQTMNAEERAAVKLHLEAMSREADWPQTQRRTAASTLRCIEELKEKETAASRGRFSLVGIGRISARGRE
jgi:hypothetical protein